MGEENYNGCVFNNGYAEKIEMNINGSNSECVDLKKLSELLEVVLIESDMSSERKLALKAKNLADEKEKGKLKAFIEENWSAFTSGTFATLVGGVLVEMFKKLVF